MSEVKSEVKAEDKAEDKVEQGRTRFWIEENTANLKMTIPEGLSDPQILLLALGSIHSLLMSLAGLESFHTVDNVAAPKGVSNDG